MTEEIYKGLPASKGIAFGKPFVFAPILPVIDTKHRSVVNIETEIEDYKEAISNSKKEIKKILKLAKDKLDDRNLLVFEAQLLFLDDPDLHKSVIGRITKEKRQASEIFVDVIRQIENRLIESNDDYIKDRIADIEDIKNRVLRRLVKEKLFSKIDPSSIVIARNLTPGDTILFSNRNLKGFATDLGGTTSHVSIIARSINVPAVVGLHDISLHIKPSDYIIIDGYKGEVIINPNKETITKYEQQVKKNTELEKKLRDIEKLPTETADGKKMKLQVNVEFNKELDYVVTHTQCEVGLYRTEHLFLEKGDFPSFHEQYRQYKMLAERLHPGNVTIRTFDIGGDKILPDSQRETNPFLGWRGIRICLDKTEIFLTQIKAILRASAKHNLKIMFPMITSLEEVLETKELIRTAKNDLKKRKIPFDEDIKVGIMIEVPSALFIADSLAKEVDFFSLGTNDLIQYVLAVARDSIIIPDMYDKFHPSILRAIKMAVNAAQRNNIPLSVCGEMAGDDIGALVLIGMGINELSVETTSYLRIKLLISKIDSKYAKKIADNVLQMDRSDEIREYLESSYKDLMNY